jgi:hypothetical protein
MMKSLVTSFAKIVEVGGAANEMECAVQQDPLNAIWRALRRPDRPETNRQAIEEVLRGTESSPSISWQNNDSQMRTGYAASRPR